MNIILLYFLLLFPAFAMCQSSFEDRNPEIFQYKEYVNSISDTTMVVLSNENFTSDNYDNGSMLNGVFVNNQLVKISSWFGLSYGINTVDYYIKEGEMVFAEEVFKGYKYDTETDEYDYSEFDIRAQGWYLFKSGEMIDTESLGHWRFEEDQIDPEERLLSEYSQYYSQITK